MKIRTFYLLLCILFASNVLFSQWSSDPAENNIVSWNTLMPFVVSDMNNGIIVICQTHYQNPIIYGQRMSVEGKRFWPGIEGVPISDSPHKQWLLDEGNRDRQFVLSD